MVVAALVAAAAAVVVVVDDDHESGDSCHGMTMLVMCGHGDAE